MVCMENPGIATTTITVFTRHSPDCSQRDNPQWKRCRCRKSLYIYEGGRVTYKSARTRSWEQAERLAQAERDARDPVKIELARIEEKRQAKNVSIESALDQWIAGFKGQAHATKIAYGTFKKSVLAWAESQGIQTLGEITPDALDAWVATWNDSLNSQGNRLSRVRSFFRWAHGLRKIEDNPTLALRSIKRENEEETQPLTQVQFNELIAATHVYDTARRAGKDRFGIELRAIFLVQRWTGLRLTDVLMLPRSGVQGNRIITKTQKTGEPIDRIVPDAVIVALNEVPCRKTMHEDQFFWSRKCNHRVLAGMWTPRIRLINRYLSFKNDKGDLMQFHSHMLRDTFAVELLLAGVSLEKVSKLLTHKSVRVTEKHYAPWVKARQRQLEDEMVAAMRKMGATFGGD